jgi:hypothetical protein
LTAEGRSVLIASAATPALLQTSILAGKLILPFEWEAACHCVVQRRCGNHSGDAERCSGIGLTLFGFIAELVFAFIPESCSRSSRNAVRHHPGIAFTCPGFPKNCYFSVWACARQMARMHFRSDRFDERLGLRGLPARRLLSTLQRLLLRRMFLRQLLRLLLVPLFDLLLPGFSSLPPPQPLVVLLLPLLELLSLPVLTGA